MVVSMGRRKSNDRHSGFDRRGDFDTDTAGGLVRCVFEVDNGGSARTGNGVEIGNEGIQENVSARKQLLESNQDDSIGEWSRRDDRKQMVVCRTECGNKLKMMNEAGARNNKKDRDALHAIIDLAIANLSADDRVDAVKRLSKLISVGKGKMK
jgi:hypothetical protein